MEPRSRITTPAELDALPLATIVMTYDGLAWQANSELDGKKHWTNTLDGHEYATPSKDMEFYDGITVLHTPTDR